MDKIRKRIALFLAVLLLAASPITPQIAEYFGMVEAQAAIQSLPTYGNCAYVTVKNNEPEFTSKVIKSGSSSTSSITSSATEASGTYILNTNTKVFHYSTCSSVRQMSEKNKKSYTGTRTEIIGMGYRSCGRCHP